jgi:hypothetical protein
MMHVRGLAGHCIFAHLPSPTTDHIINIVVVYAMYPNLCSQQQAAPRTGLTRPRGSGRQAGGAAAGGAGRGGFVPPFVGKAIDNHNNGGGGGAAGANGAGGEEGPLSARTLEMLGGKATC